MRNEGRSEAEKVVAVVVEFWSDDGSNRLLHREDFLPVPLRYAYTEFVDVHPNRPYYWNIGEIQSPNLQEKWKQGTFFDAPGKDGDGLRFRLDLDSRPCHQTDVLLEGKYGIKVVLYSKNSKPAEILLEIDWTGIWRSSERSMLQQIEINQVESFASVDP